MLATATFSSMLTGCGSTSYISSDVTSYPLVNGLTLSEVRDYYAKSMDYDSVISRNVTVHETTYETKEVSGAKAERLKTLVASAEDILKANEYNYTEENTKIVSEDVYNYVKWVIDNYSLTDKNILNMTGALGYYFVDVQYNINPKTPGSFNQMTPLIGLDGAFQTSPTQGYTINLGYMMTMTKKLNEYFAENRIYKAATFDALTGQFSVDEGDPNVALKASSTISSSNTVSGMTNTDDGTADDTLFDAAGNVIDADGNIVYTADEYATLQEEKQGEQAALDIITSQNPDAVDENGGMSYESVVSDDRMISLDTELINKVAGISLQQKAFLPDLNLVYEKPEESGVISGYGIYAAGSNGLKVFGFDRSKLAGTITLRYVFKDADDGTDGIYGTNIYVTDEEVTTGFNVSSEQLSIPEFLETTFDEMIERSDRCMSNCDLSGLMDGKVYQDMGVATLRGYAELNTNILKYLSTIRQVVARDIDNKSYLLEVETTTQESAKSADAYGTYRDKYYVVLQQQGTDFKIVDSIRMSREMAKEPSINPDDAITKRLVALNLAGAVSDEAKTNATKLLSDLYTASSNRLLRARRDDGSLITFTSNGQEITLERGMYDCFQSDASMLSSDDLEYMQSQIRSQLDKYGYNVTPIMQGTVTQWIGGADNQVEFTTEELISYMGREDGHYMQVYYLVSNMNDSWVVDERKVIDERDVSGTDLTNIQSRLGQ